MTPPTPIGRGWIRGKEILEETVRAAGLKIERKRDNRWIRAGSGHGVWEKKRVVLFDAWLRGGDIRWLQEAKSGKPEQSMRRRLLLAPQRKIHGRNEAWEFRLSGPIRESLGCCNLGM